MAIGKWANAFWAGFLGACGRIGAMVKAVAPGRESIGSDQPCQWWMPPKVFRPSALSGTSSSRASLMDAPALLHQHLATDKTWSWGKLALRGQMRDACW